MGTPCAPQLANLYCAYYELEYMHRRATLYDAIPKDTIEKTLEKAVLNSLFNWARYIDDILAAGLPEHVNIENILYDNRHINGGTDGIYPGRIAVENTDTYIDNPMELKTEQSGTTVNYLDLNISLSQTQHFTIKLYDKLRHMPVFHDYIRFPTMATVLSSKVKHGVFWSQLHRFARIITKPTDFVSQVILYTRDMLSHGYVFMILVAMLHKFCKLYAKIHNRVHSNTITERHSKKCFRIILHEIRKKPQNQDLN